MILPSVTQISPAGQSISWTQPRLNPVLGQLSSSCPGGKILALAPMQDITDLPFWRLMTTYGGADLYVTEYFRVHETSTLDRDILTSITANPTGRPVIAQVIGEDLPALIRIARELQRYPIAGIDFNLGCPAPIVCRKGVAGGLLLYPDRIRTILSALRAEVTVLFTVKTRLGYSTPDEFDRLLEVYAQQNLDLLTVHGRTVRQMYCGPVNYDLIAQAVRTLPYPVLANGDIDSADKAHAVFNHTRAQGVMIGRAAIRNPWLFRQIRQRLRGDTVTFPTGHEMWAYLRALFVAVQPPNIPPRVHIEKFKKYLNFIGPGLEQPDEFLYQARRLTSANDFERLGERFLNHHRPLRLEISP